MSVTSSRVEKAYKAFELGLRTNSAGEREAAWRGGLRLMAAEWGLRFAPDERVDPAEQFGLRVERFDVRVSKCG